MRSATFPLHRHSFAQVAIDAVLVAAAYFLAYRLRFDLRHVPKRYELLFERTIAWTVVSSIVIFALFGMYQKWWRYVGQRDYVSIIEAVVVATLSIAIVTWFFLGSRTGLALRAIADDPQAAQAMGIDVERHFSITWILTGAISVLAGAVWTSAAGGGFGLVLVGLKVFPIVIIGGLDSIAGTIAGAAVVGVLESLAAGYLDPLLGGGFSNIAAYLVLIAMLFARPYGLFGRADVERV